MLKPFTKFIHSCKQWNLVEECPLKRAGNKKTVLFCLKDVVESAMNSIKKQNSHNNKKTYFFSLRFVVLTFCISTLFVSAETKNLNEKLIQEA